MEVRSVADIKLENVRQEPFNRSNEFCSGAGLRHVGLVALFITLQRPNQNSCGRQKDKMKELDERHEKFSAHVLREFPQTTHIFEFKMIPCSNPNDYVFVGNAYENPDMKE